MRSLIAAIDSKNILLVSLRRPPPPGWRADNRLGASGDTWVTIHVRSELTPLEETTALWKADLLAGAFRDAARGRGLATVLGFTEVLEYPTGPPKANGQVIAGPFVHEFSDNSVTELAERVRRAFATTSPAGSIERVTVRFLRPIQLAPVVDVVARRPLPTGNLGGLATLRLEGWLVRVHNSDGKPIAVISSASRASIGSSWGTR